MRAVRNDINIAAPAGRVVQAFLEVDAMRRWWGVASGLVIPRAGGVWSCSWDVSVDGFGFVVLAGRIQHLQPETLLDIDNLVYLNRHRAVLGPMTLSLQVHEHRGESRVTVVQGDYGTGEDWDWYFGLVQENWPKALESLRLWLERP